MFNFDTLGQVANAAKVAAYRYHKIAKSAEIAGRYSDAEYFERLANKCLSEAKEEEEKASQVVAWWTEL